MIVALRLVMTPATDPESIEKHEFLIEAYKRLNICIDHNGYMWTRKNQDDESLVNLTYNTLTSFLRNDYKEWCEDHGKVFVNAEFKTIYDRTIHDVFHYTKNAYQDVEKAKALGVLKEEPMDDSQRL